MPRPKPTSRARPRGKGKYVPKRKVCSFCVNQVKTIDFKDVPLLRLGRDRHRLIDSIKDGEDQHVKDATPQHIADGNIRNIRIGH